MGLELAANIAVLVAVVGFMLFFLRRMDRMKDELKADMVRMETGIRRDMANMDARHKEDMAKLEAGMVRMKDELKADMVRMETGIRADMASMDARHREDMASMEAGIKAEMGLKHGEVREDLQRVSDGLVEVRERQARFEGILQGLGHASAPEPAVAAE